MSRSVVMHSDFGTEIRKRLIDLEMDVKDLASQVNFSASYVNETIRGTRNSENVKRKICDAVGLDYDELMKQLGEGA